MFNDLHFDIHLYNFSRNFIEFEIIPFYFQFLSDKNSNIYRIWYDIVYNYRDIRKIRYSILFYKSYLYVKYPTIAQYEKLTNTVT